MMFARKLKLTEPLRPRRIFRRVVSGVGAYGSLFLGIASFAGAYFLGIDNQITRLSPSLEQGLMLWFEQPSADGYMGLATIGLLFMAWRGLVLFTDEVLFRDWDADEIAVLRRLAESGWVVVVDEFGEYVAHGPEAEQHRCRDIQAVMVFAAGRLHAPGVSIAGGAAPGSAD